MELIDLDRGPPEAWLVLADQLEEHGDGIDRAFARIVRSIFVWRLPIAEDLAAAQPRWLPRLTGCTSALAIAIQEKLRGEPANVCFIWHRRRRNRSEYEPVEADTATRVRTVFASVEDAIAGLRALGHCTYDDQRAWILFRFNGRPVPQ